MFVFLYVCFLVCFMVLWVMFSIYVLLFSLHRVCVMDMHTSLCYCVSLNACSDDHCSHFCMTVLVYGQVAHIFYIMFTWSQFTCYIILVLLLLALSWEFNVFYASVSGYKYICSKFIIAPMIHDRGSDIIGGVLKLKSLIFCASYYHISEFMLCIYVMLALYPCFVA